MWPEDTSAKVIAELAIPAGKKLTCVRAQVTMKDQGWGDSGIAGAVIALHNKLGEVYAFSIYAIEHKWEEADWTVDEHKDGGRTEHPLGDFNKHEQCHIDYRNRT